MRSSETCTGRLRHAGFVPHAAFIGAEAAATVALWNRELLFATGRNWPIDRRATG
jgi:hypothetical protein